MPFEITPKKEIDLKHMSPIIYFSGNKLQVEGRLAQIRDTLGLEGSSTPISSNEWAHVKAFVSQNPSSQELSHTQVFNGVALAHDFFIIKGVPYIDLGAIASGAFGEVSMLMDEKGKMIALKRIEETEKRPAAKILPKFENEVAVNGDFGTLIDHFTKNTTHADGSTTKTFFIAMEAHDGYDASDVIGTLLDLDLPAGPKFELLLDIIKGMFTGLKDVHDHNYIHCDVKWHNYIYLGNAKCKLIDFDFAQKVENVEEGTSVEFSYGTQFLLPPEVLRTFDTEKLPALLKDVREMLELPYFEKMFAESDFIKKVKAFQSDPEAVLDSPVNGARDIYCLGASLLYILFLHPGNLFSDEECPLNNADNLKISYLYDLCLLMCAEDPSKRPDIADCIANLTALEQDSTKAIIRYATEIEGYSKLVTNNNKENTPTATTKPVTPLLPQYKQSQKKNLELVVALCKAIETAFTSDFSLKSKWEKIGPLAEKLKKMTLGHPAKKLQNSENLSLASTVLPQEKVVKHKTNSKK